MKRKKPKDQSVKTPAAQAPTLSPQANALKVHKPKQSNTCIMDEESMAISVPHATKTSKNMDVITPINSTGRKEKTVP